MKFINLSMGLLLATLAVAPTVNAQRRMMPEMTDEQKMLDAMHRNITSEKLFGYVKQLSDPALEGRLAGTKGMEQAIEIVEGYYKDFGLEPAGDNGTYFQQFPQPYIEVTGDCGMEILFPVKGIDKKANTWVRKSYPWADGWFTGGSTASGDIEADIVYCGYGVTAPELGYDDYKGIDVKGKIVLIEGETPNHSQDSVDIKKWYHHTLHAVKMKNAYDHGVAGVLYKWVPGPGVPYQENFLYCNVTDTVVSDIFSGTGRTYDECIQKIRDTFKPQSFNTGKRARIKMTTTYNPNGIGKNIFGMVKGSELPDEYVIVAAHLDHLGMIPYHIAGANDNNAAVAIMLGAAEALAKSPIKPKRTVVFMAVDAEETNLGGSTYYTQHPLFPQNKVKAVLNLEQPGVGEVLVGMYNYLYPQFAEIAKQVNDKYIHRQLFTRENHFLTRPRTDGAVFMQAGYPCMDLRASGGNGYYHHPKDDVDTINPEILQSEAEWLFWMATEWANQ